MGTKYWLVDKDDQIKFYLGKLGDEQLFKSHVEQIERLIDKLNNDIPDIQNEIWDDHHELDNTVVSGLTVSQLSFLLRCKNTIEEIPFPDRGLLPFVYFVEEIDRYDKEWDYYSEYDDDKVTQYEDYTELSNPYNH
jgi:hypothetical protein